MSGRKLTALVAVIVLVTSLAVAATVVRGAPPVAAAVPQVSRVGDDGYFRLQLPVPAGSRQGPMSLVVRVEKGDISLAQARVPYPSARTPKAPARAQRKGAASGAEKTVGSTEKAVDGAEKAVGSQEKVVGGAEKGVGGTENATVPAAAAITVTGRFGKPGPARLTVLRRDGGGSLQPLVTTEFSLPADQRDVPEVRTAWARQQQEALREADPAGTDSFTQYWNLVIAPQYGLSAGDVMNLQNQRRDPPDLYSVFTGAAAVQESLQLELLGTGPRSPAQRDAIRKAGTVPAEGIPLASLQPPQVKSHPFADMLAGRTPQVPVLARGIPADQYAVFFSDIHKEMELADLMDEWGGNLLQHMEASARDFQVRPKVTRQLCLENSLLTRMFGDRVIGSMAFTGNDPFLKEGTAFTVLFSLKNPARFQKNVEQRFAEGAGRGGVRSSFTIDGHRGMAVVSPDRRISSYAVVVGDLAVVSNSRAGLERVLAAWAGRTPSLAKSDDFRYMRTIFPQGAAEEDIFVYLSDPHIRELVGPRKKIGEARRMRCSANMTLIANARLWFRTVQHREPTFQELADGGYLGKNIPTCPDHGSYTMDKGGEAHCSLHNRPGLLTPAEEIPLAAITAEEAAQYKTFVENYNRYWSQFFDPIGIRVKIGDTVRIETCILPLIENSWYDGLAAFSGRKPGSLDEHSVLPRTVLSLRGRMAPEWLQKTASVRRHAGDGAPGVDWLGNEISLNLCDGPVLFTVGNQAMGLLGRQPGPSASLEPLIVGYLVSALNLPTYLAVKVNDPGKAEAALPALFGSLGPHSGNRNEPAVETYSMEDHRGRPMYVVNFNLFVVKLRLYAAVVGDRLVIASRRDIITDLMDASQAGKEQQAARPDASLELSLYRSAFHDLAETVNLGYQEEQRHACQANLPLAAIMLKEMGIAPDALGAATLSLRGYEPYCPSGGHYLVDPATGAVACSVHGTRWRPRQPYLSADDSPTIKLVNSLDKVNARLAFTPEGLMTTVEIKRKGGR